MANDALREVFSSMHYYVINNTSLDFVTDMLLSKRIISHSDYCRLREVRTTRTEFCRNALSLLYSSSNPQTFIRLRLALLDDYPWVVDEIDKELPPLTSRLHQPELGQSTNDECYILPRSREKNQLYEALEGQHYEEASLIMAEYKEADLVECLQTTQGTYKSCLHLIAGMADKELATELCRELLEKVTNAKNKQCLLNVRTVDEFYMDGKRFRAQVAAIHIAAYNDNSGVVTLLCKEYGVDANGETTEGLKKDIKPLDLANNNEVSPNAGKKVPPVCILVVVIVMVIVSALIAVTVLSVHKGDANVSKYADSPLHAAAYICNRESVKQLLDHGADVNARKHSDGATPLYIAAQQGCLEVVKLLIDNKANVNISLESNGDTPLHAAAYSGYTEVVKQLLDHGAEVNARKNTDGATPLYLASLRGHEDIVKLLLAKKATM